MIRALSQLPDAVLSARTDIEEPAGFGALETARGSQPLVAMDVVARVAGLTSHVTVRQSGSEAERQRFWT